MKLNPRDFSVNIIYIVSYCEKWDSVHHKMKSQINIFCMHERKCENEWSDSWNKNGKKTLLAFISNSCMPSHCQ